MAEQERLIAARNLIKAKKYDDARSVLEQIDHPTARQWLSRLEQLQTQEMRVTGLFPRVSEESKETSVHQAIASTSAQPVQNDHIPLSGLLLFLVGSIIIGIIVGLLLFWSTDFVYILGISVFIAGIIGGAFIGKVAQINNVHDRFIVGICAVLFSVLAYGTFQYFEYQNFQNTFRDSISAQASELSDAEVTDLMNEALFRETEYEGLVGSYLYRADAGIRFSLMDSSESVLSRELTYLYWVVEFFIIIITPFVISVSMVRD